MPRDAKLDAFVTTDADTDDAPEDGTADDSGDEPSDPPEDERVDDPDVGSADAPEDEPAGDPEDESGADSTMDVGVTGEPASAITPTSEWTPGGAACRTCGEQVERRWRQDGVLVCSDCKDWSEP